MASVDFESHVTDLTASQQSHDMEVDPDVPLSSAPAPAPAEPKPRKHKKKRKRETPSTATAAEPEPAPTPGSASGSTEPLELPSEEKPVSTAEPEPVAKKPKVHAEGDAGTKAKPQPKPVKDLTREYVLSRLRSHPTYWRNLDLDTLELEVKESKFSQKVLKYKTFICTSEGKRDLEWMPPPVLIKFSRMHHLGNWYKAYPEANYTKVPLHETTNSFMCSSLADDCIAQDPEVRAFTEWRTELEHKLLRLCFFDELGGRGVRPAAYVAAQSKLDSQVAIYEEQLEEATDEAAAEKIRAKIKQKRARPVLDELAFEHFMLTEVKHPCIKRAKAEGSETETQPNTEYWGVSWKLWQKYYSDSKYKFRPSGYADRCEHIKRMENPPPEQDEKGNLKAADRYTYNPPKVIDYRRKKLELDPFETEELLKDGALVVCTEFASPYIGSAMGSGISSKMACVALCAASKGQFDSNSVGDRAARSMPDM